MTITLQQLNLMPMAEAAAQLMKCCGSERWAKTMLSKRPFTSLDMLQQTAQEVWTHLSPHDWQEAFGHHPRIGERSLQVAAATAAVDWAGTEQSGMNSADDLVRRELANLNHEYERRFGYVFLICATGWSADDMLAELRRRIINDPATELHNAAQQQSLITSLRLNKLIEP